TDRYPTAAALASDLNHFLKGESVQARPARWWDRLRSWARRPERIRDAGIVAAARMFLGLSVNSLGLVLLLAGVFTVPDRAGALPYFFLSIFSEATLEAWTCWNTFKRRRAALWCGVAIPLVDGSLRILAVLGSLPSGGIGDTQDLSLRLANLA